MKRRSFFTILMILSSAAITAQDIEISKEQYLRTEHRYEIIGKVGGKVLIIKLEGNKKKLQIYDKKMRQTSEKEIKLERRSAKYVGVVASDEDFTLVYSYKRKGRLRLMARKFDNGLKLLDSTTIKLFERRAFSPSIEFVRSENKQIIALYNVRHEKKLETTAFDTKNMKVLWDRDILPNDFNYRRDFLELLVDNEGGAHIVMEQDNKRYKRESNRFNFIFYNAFLDNVQLYSISMDGKLWYDVRFMYDNLNKKIVAGGLYADNYLIESNGYFFLSVDPQNPDSQQMVFKPYEKEFVKRVLGKEKRKIKKNTINELSISEIVLRRDGGILMIAERNKKYVRQMSATTPNFYYSSRYSNYYNGNQVDYYFNNILLISIHPTGELHWTEILHKRQYSQDDGAIYSSYFLLKRPGSLRFLYNDEIKLENAVNEYVVTGNGEPKRLSLFHTADQKIMLALRFAEQVSANEIIIPSERRRQLRLVKLTYP